jgi:hypothetical protein
MGLLDLPALGSRLWTAAKNVGGRVLNYVKENPDTALQLGSSALKAGALFLPGGGVMNKVASELDKVADSRKKKASSEPKPAPTPAISSEPKMIPGGTQLSSQADPGPNPSPSSPPFGADIPEFIKGMLNSFHTRKKRRKFRKKH